MANEVLNLFPSSVHLIDIENYDVVKEKALSFIYKEQENNPSPIPKSNRGGWQSHRFYHQRDNIIKKIVDTGLSKHSEFYLDYKKTLLRPRLEEIYLLNTVCVDDCQVHYVVFVALF